MDDLGAPLFLETPICHAESPNSMIGTMYDIVISTDST